MSEHNPDRWVILKLLNNDKAIYKIMGSWDGGYLSSSYWRINSGISRVDKEGNYYLFYGFSGSVYRCHSHAYGSTPIMTSVLPQDSNDIEILSKQDADTLISCLKSLNKFNNNE